MVSNTFLSRFDKEKGKEKYFLLLVLGQVRTQKLSIYLFTFILVNTQPFLTNQMAPDFIVWREEGITEFFFIVVIFHLLKSYNASLLHHFLHKRCFSKKTKLQPKELLNPLPSFKHQLWYKVNKYEVAYLIVTIHPSYSTSFWQVTITRPKKLTVSLLTE